jgi:hypothetical protein
MTLMSEAFARVGIEAPRDRASRIVREAVERCGGNRAAAIDAITRALLDSDPEVIWEFFALDREYRLQAAYDQMLRTIREERGLDAPRPRAGQPLTAVRAADNPASARDATGSGQARIAQSGQPPHAASGPHVPQTVLTIAVNSLLRSISIDGRPLGECTAGRAREWARARGRESRFVYLLAHGLQDSQIIGLSKTEEDARQARALADSSDNG